MATKQFLMLDKISMEYHAFRKDQVLTHKQLNELIDYFEDQDRLTRTCLIGVGLVCGLAVAYNAAAPSITVGRGCGVTTDGDLMTMEPTTFNNFKAYDNRKKGTTDPIYDPFWPATDGGKQIPLWELVVPDGEGKLPLDSKALSTFNAATGTQLDDMTALLYLEYYLQDPDKCTAIDCDNQGPLQVAQIKFLLLSKVDMEKVINRDPNSEVIADSIYKKYHDSGVQYFGLPMLKAKRVILNSSNTSSIALLAKSYTGIVHTEGNKLIKAVADLYNGFKFMVDPLNKTNLSNLRQALQQALATNPKIYHAQYLYDYYKDILTAYNELRESLFRCMYECCPDKYAFPKHIMLGELKPAGIEPAPYRHEFYPSPAVSDNKDKVAQCRSQWQRLQQMIQQFNLPDQPSPVRITPSTDYDRCLENRAIPFYYKDAKALLNNWNYGWSIRGTEKNVLSYHAGQYGSGIESTTNPLDYSIDSNNFFRIEGHLGKQLSDAMRLIDNIKNNKSVPFDLVAVRLNKTGNLSDINIDDFDCQFEDLTAILRAWLIEQNCLYANIARFFSGFSTRKENGFHTRIDDYKAVAQPTYFAAGGEIKEMQATPVSGIRFTEKTMATAVAATVQPMCKTIYSIDTTVVGNLETHKDSLGIAFAETMKQPGISADNIIADVKRRTVNDPNLVKLSLEEKELAYEVPITLVAHAHEISATKPFAVDEINTDLLEKYMARMERLCAYVKKLRSRMESIFSNASYARYGFEAYYLFLIEQLTANCCAAEKLEGLMDEINKRKKKILDSLLFANYASTHPGLEHKAGVHRGGTFVLVYAQEVRTRRSLNDPILIEATENATRADIVLLKASETKVLERSSHSGDIYHDLDSFAYYLVTHQGKVDFDREVATYSKLHGIKHGTVQEQIFTKQLSLKIKEICARLTKDEEATVAANVVVADFTLPYLCCSDCPPMTFIMPKQDFSLSLPKAAVCNDEGMQLFHREPADGVVKASAGFESTVVYKDGNAFFDPFAVPAASFGKEISFTIDDQKTDCRIMVSRHPVAKFEFKVDKEDDNSIQVIFTNVSDDATGKEYVYEWDFGDGRSVLKVDNKNAIVIFYKKDALEKLGLNGKIPVKLTATNGPCSNAFTLDVPYQKVVPVSLSLPKEVVCDDNPQLKFTVQPTTGVVASLEEPGAVVKVNNEFFFDPKLVKVFGKVITFTVNGKPTTCHITVYQHPKPAFNFSAVLAPSGASALMQVTFTNLSDPANNQQLNYHWAFSDKTTKDTNSSSQFSQTFDLNVLKSLGQTALTVELTAGNPGCQDKIQRVVPFPIIVTAATCQDTVITAVKAEQESLQTTEIKSFLASIQTSPEFTPLITQLNATAEILVGANKQILKFNQPAFQQVLLRAIRTQLQNIYASKFGKQANDIVLTPEVRALQGLALNLVKCETTIQLSKEGLLGIINDFLGQLQLLMTKLPGLNKGNVMVNFVETFLSNTHLTDTQVIDKIKELGKQYKVSFQP